MQTIKIYLFYPIEVYKHIRKSQIFYFYTWLREKQVSKSHWEKSQILTETWIAASEENTFNDLLEG